MKRMILIIGILFFMCAVGNCDESLQKPRVKVTAILKTNLIDFSNAVFDLADADRPNYGGTGAPVVILAKVQNISKESIQWDVLTCNDDSDHWSTDNKLIYFLSSVCDSRHSLLIVLKPGESYEFSIDMWMTTSFPLRDIHFKVGYKGLPKVGSPLWSNELVLHIKPPLRKSSDWH